MSAPTSSRLLNKHDEARRVHAKEKAAGSQPPDRDLPFQDIAAQQEIFATAGTPIISVDTKQKALIGHFKHAGQAWGQPPEEGNVHDFLTDALGRAVPYGSDDLQRHAGAVSVGASADTAALAVTTMAHWWAEIGGLVYPQAKPLLILADAGGSHGSRPRRWKAPRPSPLRDRLGLRVTVCHDPTGGSKWHPIAPRLLSQSSLNWAGKPLRTFDTRLGYLCDTTTTTGLQVTARLLAGGYETGLTVTDAVMKTLNVEHHALYPSWN